MRQRARVVLGVGQGGLICILLGLPLVVEAACRARIVADRELLDIRRAWSGITALVVSDPIMLPQRSSWPELQAAIPELTMIQPRGVPRIVFASDAFLRKAYATHLAAAAGTVSVSPGDPCGQRFWVEAARALSAQSHRCTSRMTSPEQGAAPYVARGERWVGALPAACLCTSGAYCRRSLVGPCRALGARGRTRRRT